MALAAALAILSTAQPCAAIDNGLGGFEFGSSRCL